MSLYIPPRGSVVVGAPYAASAGETVKEPVKEQQEQEQQTPSRDEVVGSAVNAALEELYRKYGYRPEALVQKLAAQLYKDGIDAGTLAKQIVEKVDEMVAEYALSKFEEKARSLLSDYSKAVPLLVLLQAVAKGMSGRSAASKVNQIVKDGGFKLKPSVVEAVNVTERGVKIGNVELTEDELKALLSYVLEKSGAPVAVVTPRGTSVDIQYDGSKLRAVIKVTRDAEEKPVVVVPLCGNRETINEKHDGNAWIAGAYGWGLDVPNTGGFRRVRLGPSIVCGGVCSPASDWHTVPPSTLFYFRDRATGYSTWAKRFMMRGYCGGRLVQCYEKNGYWMAAAEVWPCSKPKIERYDKIVLETSDKKAILQELDKLAATGQAEQAQTEAKPQAA